MTERRKRFLRIAYPAISAGWLLLGFWNVAMNEPTVGWGFVGAGVAYLFAAVHFEWKLRRELRVEEAGVGEPEVGRVDGTGVTGSSTSERPIGERTVGLSAGARSRSKRAWLVATILTVVRFRAIAAWRKALNEKGKLVFGGALGVLLIVNFFFAFTGPEQGHRGELPIDLLFAIVTFFVVMTLFQLAPLAPWFDRRAGVRFGLSAGRRATLTIGTNALGLTLVLVLLNEVLAFGLWGAGWPRGLEWVFEGMDVVAALGAMVVAGPVGAVILGARSRRRWFGAGLGLLLLIVLAASAVEPLWAGEAVWAQGAVSGGRLLALAALLAAGFAPEQRSPDDRGGGRKWSFGRRTSGNEGKRGPADSTRRPSRPAGGDWAAAGVWSRPTFVFALAEARMMLRFRQVRLNLVLSWIMPVFMAIVLSGEEPMWRVLSPHASQSVRPLADARMPLAAGEEAGHFALWGAAALGAFLCAFWIAFFANLLGFTADGARRLSMSADRALGACLPGKVLGLMAVVGGLVLLQMSTVTWLLAERIPIADRPIPLLFAACSLVCLAGAGTAVSIWWPRRPKLHEQRDLYSSVMALALLGCGWLLFTVVVAGVAVAARLLAGSGTAVIALTMLLLVSTGGSLAVVGLLSRGDWLRRRLREWAVAA